MAVVLIFLTVLMLCMLELCRGLQVRQMLTDAARKGCRTGILRQYGNTDIQNDVNNIINTDYGFTTAQWNPPAVGTITITVIDPSGNTLNDALDAPPGTQVSVQVSMPSSSMRWSPMVWLTDSYIVSDLVVMMKQ
jgi:Flp pilus assembly protein TadG